MCISVKTVRGLDLVWGVELLDSIFRLEWGCDETARFAIYATEWRVVRGREYAFFTGFVSPVLARG